MSSVSYLLTLCNPVSISADRLLYGTMRPTNNYPWPKICIKRKSGFAAARSTRARIVGLQPQVGVRG
jgi:hypothetical protein